MSGRMKWERARHRPSQSITDDSKAADRWLRQHALKSPEGLECTRERQQHASADDIVWGPWREFERNGLKGWERDGVRRARS
jgi:hypothetical protein